MMGPRCPACGSKVKLPKNAPLPPPHAKVKCPSCGSVGELEAFLSAAGMEEHSAGVTRPIGDGPASSAKAEADTAPGGSTRIAGSASKLNLPAGLRCTLTVLSGPDSGKKLQVDRPRVVVGRGGGDFQLSDPDVSAEHCAFEITGVTCTVRDLGSRNGTYVDGRKVGSETLASMGEVVVGNTTLLFTMTLEESSSAS